MSGIQDALGVITRVGGYFTVVSFIPAATLTSGVWLLAASEPWTGAPHPGRIASHVAELNLSGLAVGFFVAAVVSFILHPLQFVHVQLMEGYWGTGRAARKLGAWAAEGHYHRFDQAQREEQAASTAQDTARASGREDKEVAAAYEAGAFAKLLTDYPDNTEDILPTRLGNVLRRYERRAGRPYGIDAVLFAPTLTLTAPPNQVAYLNDQRTQLDLAVRFSSVFVLMAVGWFCMLITSGWWLLLSAAPYAVSLLFYRGAVASAHHYGTALQSVLDLSRRKVYEQLGLTLPVALAAERRSNKKLMRLLRERPRDAT